MESNKVVMLRHGESEWNKSNRFCGWYDADLSEKGVEDAIKIAAAALIENKMEFDIAFSSVLKRGQNSLNIILKELNCCHLLRKYDWRLNERHYGNLTGFNKREMADKYGEEQVQIWRRRYDVLPPPIEEDNPYYKDIMENPSFANIPKDQFPLTECLKTVMERVVPFWENEIMNEIVCGKRVLIVAHGTVLRALIKHIEGISDENIASVNVPNSIPCVYEFNTKTRELIGKITYLADENFLNKQMEKVAAIGNK